ncbi:MAG: ABC transporter ATP-binding protein [Oscillospiraceae bacterium]|jgi:putative ABC transport system ATP-binding protein|nr:ABC transporter ATP-binding protein [Oscillospiraceae bacterium]MCI1990158.1 ABC transporter ATP-binding protein [Oscillospiraceae bacterium]MCI2034885.1 ABC transporter ATP-binding protein [Oscillospiraceae bacterium]
MILEARNIAKTYLRGGMPFSAVDDVSLEIGEGEFVCIEGRSGSGKSTLLSILAGLLTPTSGTVRFGGKDYAALGDRERSFLRNTKLGYIMQGQSVLPNLTVLQNVLLPFTFFRRDGGSDQKALGLLDRAGLLPLAEQYPASLSGGEMRRVAIVRALLASPLLLIADEPTGDLDETTTREIMELFESAAKGGTAVLMVTHDKSTTRYAGRCFTMRSGKLTAG